MATMTTTIVGKLRTDLGTHAARKLRRQGQLPAVIYGHKIEPLHIMLKAEDVWSLIRHGERVVDVVVENREAEKCFVREIQWDALGKEVLHVDFVRIRTDERVRTSVPIQLRGSPAGLQAGGVLQQLLHALEVECLAVSVPEAIRVNVADLQLGQAIHVRDLKLPEGVVAVVEPDAIVVQVSAPKAEAPPAEAVPGPVEPEVIGRRAAQEEEEEAR
ncbi:MAG: 50S ribosomal protein L25 [Gemmatales bacterium]|nr:50S ribosomal protein L25 [Gemmatales bacterium]MCS7158985.1 50S ribosomal protein L25 [Gemmatales bacterium]MDW8174185.1 50S ribosomal protein L25 [Gemmatales bacterium]MDW8221844.1 50S ribosomal protein L25 [Gemmatales bacterium]